MSKTDNDKLDWMYKGAHSQVDREEYLLGKSVDKTFEQLNAKEKEKKLGLVPPKNHVEHECIPPSIRDYNKIVQQEQVDLSAKLQEDPLVAIKKQEEDARRQFLQNPIQLKKLQDALKAQETKKNKKKKRKSKKQSDSEEDLDRQLSEKLKNLTGIIKKEKKSNNDHLDVILMHKFNQLKNKLSQKDLDDIMAGKSSDSEDDESPKPKKQKKRSSSSSSSNDSDYSKRKPHKVEVARNKSNKSKNNYEEKKKRSYSKDYKKKRDSSESRKSKKDLGREKYNKYHESRSSSNDRIKDKRKNDIVIRKKHTNNSSSSSSCDERRKTVHKEKTASSQSNKQDDDLDKLILEKLRMLRDSKPNKTEEKEDKPEEDLIEYSHYDSENDEYVVKKKSFGLVRSDGTKIPLKNPINPDSKEKQLKKSEPPRATTDVRKNKTKKLSDKEKEELRKAMMVDAVKRDKERSDNLRKHRQENQRDESKIDDFDKNFVHRELSKSHSNIKDVHSRIRSNLNNIQRSTQHMNSNFSKRS